jgi:hypothetical protein
MKMKPSCPIGVEAALDCLWISLSGRCQPRADSGVPATPAGQPAGVTPRTGGAYRWNASDKTWFPLTDSGLFRSEDTAATWAAIHDDQHRFGFAGAITGDPRVDGSVFVGTGGREIVYGEPLP